ncbi:hypothetical protein BASA81_005893 [Batrachochytrium salamandrivorans]|nr:hypothetical protein BASA81_005893 [Batrachochytrium salamandrivorans]
MAKDEDEGSDSELDLYELMKARMNKKNAPVAIKVEEDDDILTFSIYTTPSKPAPIARLSPQPRRPLPSSSTKKLVFKPVSIFERKLKTCTQYVREDFILNSSNGRVRPMVRVVDLSLFPEAMQDYILDRRQSSQLLFVEITEERVEMDEVCLVELEHQIPFAGPRSKQVERMLDNEQGNFYGAMKEADSMYQAALARQKKREADELEVAQLRHVLAWEGGDEEDEKQVVVAEQTRQGIVPFTFRVGKELAIQPRLQRGWEHTKVLQITRGEKRGEYRVQMDNGWWMHDTDYIKTKHNSAAFRFEQFVQAGSRFELGNGPGEPQLDATIKRARLEFNQQAREKFPEFAHLAH